MRHASMDAPRIQKNRRPRFHNTTKTAWMRHASTDTSRIQSSELQIINWTEDSFTWSLSPFFSFHTPLSELVQRSDSTNFHPFSFLERESSCSKSLFFIEVYNYAYFARIWRQKIRESEFSTEKCLLRVFLLFYCSFLAFLWFLFVERCL